MRDLVHMADEGIEHAGLAEIEGMAAAFGRQRDLARQAHFAPARIAAKDAAGGDYRHLRRPAAAESRHLGIEGGLGEFDLGADARVVVVDRQAAAGPGNAVILFECCTLRQAGTGIGGMDHVAFRPGQAFLEHADIKIARRRGAAGDQFGAACLVIAVDHQKPGIAPLLAIGRGRAHIAGSFELSIGSLSPGTLGGKSARPDSLRSARRRAGNRNDQRAATDRGTLPPTSTARTGPRSAAPDPPTKAPSSLEAPMRTDSTPTT